MAVEELVANGFRVEKDYYSPQAFGNRQIVLQRKGLTIEFLLDRSYWTLEIGATVWERGFYLDLWLACLDNSVVSLEQPALEDQIALVFATLQDIERAVLLDASIEDRLRRQEQRLLERRGWAGISGPGEGQRD
jgi:hypothetical protein